MSCALLTQSEVIVFTENFALLVSLIDKTQKTLKFPEPIDTIERSMNFMKNVPCLVVTTDRLYSNDLEKI